MNIKTVVLLIMLYSIINLNIIWGCCISPCIEAMKNQNLKQLIKPNIKYKNPFN